MKIADWANADRTLSAAATAAQNLAETTMAEWSLPEWTTLDPCPVAKATAELEQSLATSARSPVEVTMTEWRQHWLAKQSDLVERPTS